MHPLEKAFLDRAALCAAKAGHIYPSMAACEAALESRYGSSELAIRDSNLFGMKQHAHPVYGTHALPTNEFEKGQWVEVTALWIHYPDWNSCFLDRMATLERLSNALPHYRAALDAKDEETYIREVSKSWATDPARADKVIAVYREYTARAA